METSKEERSVVAKRPFVKDPSKEEESVEAKSRRTENQIIQGKHQIMVDLKDLQARKSKLQAQIDEKLAQFLGSGPSSKPDELSDDPLLIKEIELREHHKFENDAQSKGFLNRLKLSNNLKVFSFDLNFDDYYLEKELLKALPSFNHQHLEEFRIKGHHDRAGEEQDYMVLESQSKLLVALMKYLENCPNLKILKIEYDGENYRDRDEDFGTGKWKWQHLGTTEIPEWHTSYFSLEYLESNDCGTPGVLSMKFPNLEELHLSGFELSGGPKYLLKILNTFHQNLPKLRRLCLNFDLYDLSKYFKILQKFASETNIMVEFAGMPKYDLKPVLVKLPNLKIFNPQQGGEDPDDGKGLGKKDLREPEEDSGK